MRLLCLNKRKTQILCLLWAIYDSGLFQYAPERLRQETRNSDPLVRKKVVSYDIDYCSIVFLILDELFFRMRKWNVRSEFYVSEWIRNGWIAAQDEWKDKNYFSCFNLHAANDADSRANFRILRQLFALGVFSSSLRSSDAQFAYCWKTNCRKYSSGKSAQFSCCWRPNCKNCSSGQSAKPPNECLLLAPLKTEFYRQPLSLLQLSRLQIRCAVAINEFEHRVKTLRLPPALLTYVWRANEMLSPEILSQWSW